MTIHSKMKKLLGEMTTDAHAEAGKILQQTIDDLITRKEELNDEIKELESAWSDWDFDYLLKHKYLSASLVKQLKAERDYVYGK